MLGNFIKQLTHINSYFSLLESLKKTFGQNTNVANVRSIIKNNLRNSPAQSKRQKKDAIGTDSADSIGTSEFQAE